MHKRLLQKRHGNRGMSLVELLLVMGILSIVMMAVISLYVPVHQSTVAQTQVSDVQSNLRLALKVMTRDLLMAGFLVPDHPIAFPDAAPDFYVDIPTSAGTLNNSEFIIRTRVVGDGFARVTDAAVSGSGFELTVSDPDMVDRFPEGTKVRLFEPIMANEVIKDTGSPADRIYTVLPQTTSGTIKITGGGLALTDILAETVIIRASEDGQPALQTIQYRLNNGALEREVNDKVQFLARNLDAVNFTYNFTDQGRVNRVDIRLTGQTKALKNDALSGEKTRSVETSVKLRNIF